jgi:protein TonB
MGIAASGHEDTSFVAFSFARREHWHPHHGYARDRVTAAFGTLLVCGLYILLGTEPGLFAAPTPAIRIEVVAGLVPSTRTYLPRLSVPFSSSLLRPKAGKVVPPQFTIEPEETATNVRLSAAVSPLPPKLIAGAQDQTAPAPPAGATGVSANGSNDNTPAVCFDAAWARAVTDHMQRFFYYPAVARTLRVTALVMVHFIERRDGSLDMVEVSKSSGVRGLDNAAINIVRDAQPLPAIPDRMHLNWIDLELPIDFGIPDLDLNPTPGNCG